ncbi:MAG: globin [Ilumatobacteraceae bacterium]|nr:globin [Ilumatobacteraceae bacterium]
MTADPASDAATEPASLYERVGGADFFERLVDAFYDGVETDDVLAPLYPEAPDFTGARHRLTLFLVQYWGGPTTYMDERGHPRLRMRHFPFHVGPLERDHWLAHMAAAVEATCSPEQSDVAAELMQYFVPAAEHLRNDTGLPITSSTFNRG